MASETRTPPFEAIRSSDMVDESQLDMAYATYEQWRQHLDETHPVVQEATRVFVDLLKRYERQEDRRMKEQS